MPDPCYVLPGPILLTVKQGTAMTQSTSAWRKAEGTAGPPGRGPRGWDGTNQREKRGNGVPDRGTSTCKGQEQGEDGAEGARQRVEGDRVSAVLGV